MFTATMTSKGQLTIPKEMRTDLNLTTGSKVTFIRLGNGQYRILPQTRNVMDLAGILHNPDGPVLTLEAIEESIQEGWAESGLRGSSANESDQPQ